jgi:Cu+-exporting ATPase
MVRDPVCGAKVDEKQTGYTSLSQGQRYFFCSPGCQQRFDQNPQRYAGQGAE